MICAIDPTGNQLDTHLWILFVASLPTLKGTLSASDGGERNSILLLLEP